MSPPRALVLAAGKSTRIAESAGLLPKPLIDVAGKTPLEHNLGWLAESGVEDVFINLHHRGDLIRAHCGDGARFRLRIRYSEEPELLGTAGAMIPLRRELEGADFLVLYGDNVSRFSLAELLSAHRASNQKHEATATIAVFDFAKTPNSGIAGGRVLFDEERRVRSFIEGASIEGASIEGSSDAPFVNAGVYAISPRLLRYLPERPVFTDFARDVFPALLERGERIYAHPIAGFCFGIDTPAALENARARVKMLPEVSA